MSVTSWSFLLDGFLLKKINCIQMKLPNFVNWHSARTSKSAKIILSKSIFYVKNLSNVFKKKFKNINFWRLFLFKNIFEPLYFLKPGPIFIGPAHFWAKTPSSEKLHDVTALISIRYKWGYAYYFRQIFQGLCMY